MTTDDERLRQFLAGTFHQDWMDEFKSIEDAVAEYARSQRSNEIFLSVFKGITRLLASGEDDAALGERLSKITGANLTLRVAR